MALGSLAELDTQITIAVELKYMNDEDLNNINMKITELRKMISGVISKLITDH
jgi:four helix bundle protein